MKRTREDLFEILCIGVIVAVFCLPAQSLRMTGWAVRGPDRMFLRTPSLSLTFPTWNR